MTARDGGYSGDPFKVQCGVTQGDPLYPAIFNVAVDAILRHWIYVVEATDGIEEPVTEGFGQDIQQMAEYFYSNNGLLTPTWATRIQKAFYVLMGMFERVELYTSAGKTVSMAYQPC